MDYRAVIESVYEELERGDIDAAYRDFADDCVLTSNAGSIEGRQAMIASDRQTLSQLTSHNRTLDRTLVDGSHVVTWITWSGTVAVTGKSFECPICNVFHFEGRRVSRWESYGELAAAYAAFGA